MTDSFQVAFIADVHIANHQAHGGPTVAGINTRAQMCLDALKDAAQFVLRKRPGTPLIVAGDLFDHAKPSPQLITATQKALASVASTYLLLGNHDRVSALEGDHALGPMVLQHVGATPELYPTTNPQAVIAMLPFRNEPAKGWFADALSALVDDACTRNMRVIAVCCHLGLYAKADIAKAPYDITASNDAISVEFVASTCKDLGIPAVLAGNWHKFRAWTIDGVQLIQIGALVPTGWDNPTTLGEHDPYGAVVVLTMPDLDSAPRFSVRTTEGPRFVTIQSANDLPEILRDDCFIRWSGDSGTACARVDALRSRGLTRFEVLIDKESAKAQAHQAAVAARSQDTLLASLTEFTNSIAIPDIRVDDARFRPLVLARAKTLLSL